MIEISVYSGLIIGGILFQIGRIFPKMSKNILLLTMVGWGWLLFGCGTGDDNQQTSGVDGEAINGGDQHAAAMGMSLGGKNHKLEVFPCETFVVGQVAIHCDVLPDRVKRAAVVVVVV